MKTLALALAWFVAATAVAQEAPMVPAREAAQHAGKTITMTGKVASAKLTKGGHLFLNLEERFPNEVATVFISKDRVAEVGLDESVSGKQVEARGEVRMVKGKPQIEVKSKDQITVKEADGTTAAPAPAPAPAEPKREPSAPAAPATDAPASQAAAGSVSAAVPGTPLTVSVPVPSDLQGAAGGASAVVTVLVPDAFDAAQPHRILLLPAGSDGAPKITGFDAAAKKGWVVLSGGMPSKPASFNPAWNHATAAAALAAVKSAWPGAESWPVAVGGQSGGAKGACALAVALAKGGVSVKGLFLSGLADDALTKAYRDQKPEAAFLSVPVVLSSASGDHVATPALVEKAAESMKAGGFTAVQVLTRDGRFGVDPAHLALALEQFAK